MNTVGVPRQMHDVFVAHVRHHLKRKKCRVMVTLSWKLQMCHNRHRNKVRLSLQLHRWSRKSWSCELCCNPSPGCVAAALQVTPGCCRSDEAEETCRWDRSNLEERSPAGRRTEEERRSGSRSRCGSPAAPRRCACRP